MPLDQIDYEPKPSKRRVEEVRMSFGDHLEDLRRRLILALAGPLITSILGLVYGREIIGWLVKPLAEVQLYFGLPPQTYNLAVTTGFGVYMKVGLITGLVIAAPWVVYQIWKFVESGLYDHEKKAAYLVAPFSGVMSLLGVLFMYYILLPISLAFLIYFTVSYPALDMQDTQPKGFMGIILSPYAPPGQEAENPVEEHPLDTGLDKVPLTLSQIPATQTDPTEPVEGQIWFNQTDGVIRYHTGGRTLTFVPQEKQDTRPKNQSMVAPMIEIGQYISFVTMMGVAVIVSFQLPVLMMILGWTGLIEPKMLSKYRRYCVFACFVLGAFLTPADPISMVALALPLWGLYELGLLVMGVSFRKTVEDGSEGDE